jgi:hypothetical protein
MHDHMATRMLFLRSAEYEEHELSHECVLEWALTCLDE